MSAIPLEDESIDCAIEAHELPRLKPRLPRATLEPESMTDVSKR